MVQHLAAGVVFAAAGEVLLATVGRLRYWCRGTAALQQMERRADARVAAWGRSGLLVGLLAAVGGAVDVHDNLSMPIRVVLLGQSRAPLP